MKKGKKGENILRTEKESEMALSIGKLGEGKGSAISRCLAFRVLSLPHFAPSTAIYFALLRTIFTIIVTFR